jgi:hypothetical protein
MSATILYENSEPIIVEATPQGEDLWLDDPALKSAAGWEIKAEGICREDICIPLPKSREGAFIQGDGVERRFNLTAFARYLDQPVAVDIRHAIWSFGPSSQELRDQLLSLEAPDFSLPDMVNGRTYALSDFRGKKVLLLLWASW